MVSFIRRNPFLPIVITLMAGIHIASYIQEICHPAFTIIGLVILLLLASVIPNLGKSSLIASSQIVILLSASFLLGMSKHLMELPRNQITHYVHQIDTSGDNVLAGQIKEVMTSRYIMQLDNINAHPAHGKILLLDRDRPEVGDRLIVKANIIEISDAKNPFSFDFKNFYRNRKILYQARSLEKIKLNTASWNLAGWMSSLRAKCRHLIQEIMPTENEFYLTAALTLGYKRELGAELKNAFADTGTMHVLAVSGLHVGVVYMLMMLVLRHLFPQGFYWRLVRSTLVLASLWFFVYLVGAPISAWRAAFMFSLFEIGMLTSRGHYPVNTLAFAAFVLLLIDSHSLYEVSFQLSFLAVLGIVNCQKAIQDLWIVENWLGNKMWQLVSLSFAAQIFTLPLSIYYFHQFPLYFWLSGIIAVPLAFFLLSITLGFLLLHWIPIVGQIVGFMAFGTAYLMNAWIFLVQKLPGLILEGLWINRGQVFLILSAGVCLSIYLNSRRLKYLNWTLMCCTVLFGSICYQKIRTLKQVALIFYHNKKSDYADLFIGQDVYPILSGTTEPLPRDIEIARSAMGAIKTANIASQQVVFLQKDLLYYNRISLLLSDSIQTDPVLYKMADFVGIRTPVTSKQLEGISTTPTFILSSTLPYNGRGSEELIKSRGHNVFNVSTEGAFVIDLKR